MLKLKLQYFGHLMWRTDSLEKTLMLRKIEGGRRGWLRMRRLDGITDEMDMSLSRLRELGETWYSAVHGFAKSQTQLSNWTNSQWSRSICFFLELPCFFYDPMDFGNLNSGSSTLSKSSSYIWKFLFHILLKPSLMDFEDYLASMWNEHTCAVVWTFFGIAFLWDWNENWYFPVLWPLLSFPNLLT